MNKGLLFVISGFSGAGKGTLMKLLVERYPDYALSVSATTRKPREGERDGIEYFFKSEEEFDVMVQNGELLEYEGYVGHYYGTPRKYVEEMMACGKDVILEIDVRGGLNIKKQMPEAILIFVTAPSVGELERRLRGRASESDEDIQARMSQIEREMKSIRHYDYLLVNDNLEKALERMNTIADAERQKVARNTVFIENLEKEIYGGRA